MASLLEMGMTAGTVGSTANESPIYLQVRTTGIELWATADPTPEEALTEKLITDVQDLGLPQGIENSLVSKLEGALDALDRGRTMARSTS